MPLLQLDIASLAFSPEQGQALRGGLTTLMADVLHKRADLTVVSVSQHRPEAWSVGGLALTDEAWSASLQVFITAGSNDEDERARFISAADALIHEVMQGPAATPLYIVVHEVPAGSWGYDGLTQAARKRCQTRQPVLTLKQMAGLPPATVPPPTRSALLLIDFQQEYVDGALPLPDVRCAAAQASALMAAADRMGMPVIHVHHEAASALAPAFCARFTRCACHARAAGGQRASPRRQAMAFVVQGHRLACAIARSAGAATAGGWSDDPQLRGQHGPRGHAPGLRGDGGG